MFKYIYFFIACLLCTLATPSFATNQEGLQTQDKSCRFYYLTSKNTQGWYISVSPEMCKNGLVQGQGQITIYNAFSKPTEQIYGFFNAGYWTGETALSASILGRSVDPDGTQKVFFNVPNDSYIEAKFIGQMTALKQKDGTYGTFSFCNPFRVLVQTSKTDTFQNQDLTTNLIDTLVKQVRTFCPAERTILLYASSTDRPKPEDIFFYASVDLQTAHIDVKKNMAFTQTIPTSTEQPIFEEQAIDMPLVSDVPTLPTDLSDLGIEALQESEINAPTSDPLIVPVPKTSEITALLPQEIPALLDKVPHLLVSSKILKKPVLGAAVVRIKSIQGSIAVADKPATLQITGDGLTPGWGIISGTFAYQQGVANLGLQGTVQVSSFVPCTQERCQELEGKDE